MREKNFKDWQLLRHIVTVLFSICVSGGVSAQPIMGEEPQTVDDVFLPEVAGVTAEVWVRNMQIPWSLVFLPNGDALVAERRGQIQRIARGQDQVQLYHKFDEVAHVGDGGLMGMALHPQFDRHPFIYVMHTYKENEVLINRVVRLRHQGDSAVFDGVVLDGLPGNESHIGGRIAFGPDGMLYVGTGDLWQQPLAQDLKSPAGKIHRVAPNGQIPADNPFPGSTV